MVTYVYNSSRSEEVEKMFNALDKDGSGDLDTEELMVTLQETCMLEPFMIRDFVSEYDLNKDGKVNRTEFNNLWSKLIG